MNADANITTPAPEPIKLVWGGPAPEGVTFAWGARAMWRQVDPIGHARRFGGTFYATAESMLVEEAPAEDPQP